MFFSRHYVKKDPIIKEFDSLGTIIKFKVYGNKAQQAIDKAMDKINDIDNKMSFFKEYSELSKINHNAGKAPAKVGKDTYFVIKKAVEYSALSGGAFDPTNYKDIILDERNNSIMLKNENQELDVGSIAKGYAADEVKNIFRKNKIENALIDFGGSIFAMGSKIDGTPWNIGVQDPLKATGEYALIVSVANKSIVTAGKPSENGIISATIVSDHSIDGDALSTCVFVMGLDMGMTLIESIKGVDAIFITKNKVIYTTSGIKGDFELLNNDFAYGC